VNKTIVSEFREAVITFQYIEKKHLNSYECFAYIRVLLGALPFLFEVLL